ncbi:MAG: helix-turn-helix domain-containing protein [Elusimicrobia bacterium]|nr:helix-turn-helix domain-containing protein [Elusimicrobiota bacterium]
MNTLIGTMLPLPEKPVVPWLLCADAARRAGMDQFFKKRRDPERRVFFPSAQRAQITALACTLPKDFDKPLSRWSSPDLAELAVEKGIVSTISPSTIREWLRQDKIKPWQHRSWQKPTAPLFLERATVVLDLYEQAQALA